MMSPGRITRTVADAALVLSVIAGPDGLDPRQPRDLAPDDYVGALARGAEGMRVGVVAEGFGHPNSEAAVDDAVRAGVDVLRGAGLTAEEVHAAFGPDLTGAEAARAGGNGV